MEYNFTRMSGKKRTGVLIYIHPMLSHKLFLSTFYWLVAFMSWSYLRRPTRNEEIHGLPQTPRLGVAA
jgi:hypothetical protein